MPAVAGADPLVPALARVRWRRQETADTWTLELEPEEPDRGWDFQPGQFNMLSVFGVGEAAISLSGDPSQRGRLVHTVRAVGPVSGAIAGLSTGEVLGVRGPFGAGWPLSAAAGADVLIIAGGLGLAPLRPLLYELRQRRVRFGRVVLLYGTRSPDDILFRRELENWRSLPDVEIEITVDHALRGWSGHVGVVTTLIARAGFDPPATTAFVCGPEVMMRFAIAGCREVGVAEERIYLSMERNMKCAVGHCGHCQFGPVFVCRDGPVLPYPRVSPFLGVREF